MRSMGIVPITVPDSLLARESGIIRMTSNIIERPTSNVSTADAVKLLTTPPTVTPSVSVPVQMPGSGAAVSPTATATQPVQDQVPSIVEPPISDPGQVQTAPGMGSQLVQWAKDNPLPAVLIGAGILWGLHEIFKPKK